MLHAECKVRPWECQDEMTIEPCSKKMKSTEEAHNKFCDDCFHGSNVKADTERTNNERILLGISDDQGKQEVQQKENEISDILEISNEDLSNNGPEIVECTHSKIVENVNLPFVSINDTKLTENKCPIITEKVDEANIEETSNKSFTVNGGEVEIEEYSTSKAFIGPVYKPVEENKWDETRNCTKLSTGREKQNGVLVGKIEKEEAKKTQALSCDVPEIDEELCQFYKEIQQLERDRDELESNSQQKETELSQERFVPYNKYSQTSLEVEQDIWFSRTQSNNENEQCYSNTPSGQKMGSEPKCFDIETNGWRTENHFDWQMDSKFWNHSVPQFRPGWQPMQSFIVPQGPLPPRFNHHLDVQTLSSSPHQPNILHVQNDGPHKNYAGYHGRSGITNRSCPLFDQNISYAGHIGIHSTQVSRNGNSDHDGCISNGFCETQEETRKDPRIYQVERIHNSYFQQFSEDKLCRSRKLLLILRGLPGSGKTTLSRIILGQNHDGVVFSTDDYFRQQDGYTYNVAQLGDAHDWNQKRAKQAMDQGRSPIIIDNTNTQAWEMKPYVEMALGKGYRVEFHEPDTWWKFDPEELEKRNKHGVSREKIAQMLDRYEYQMSISVVMNSVEPPHKNTQRPPPQRRQRETNIKKKPGHRLSKAKQRKKRKRNRKVRSDHIKMPEKISDGVPCHLIPDDQETSESVEEDSEEENRKSVFTFNGNPGDPIEGCEDGSNDDNSESLKSTAHHAQSFPIAVSETSAILASNLESEFLAKDDGPGLINWTSVPPKNLTEHSLDDQMVDDNPNNIAPPLELENQSNSIDTNDDKSSGLKIEYNSEENSYVMLSNQDELTSDQTACEPELESKLLNVSNGKKEPVSLQHDLKTSEICVILPEKTVKERQTPVRNEKNPWAFFSIDLADMQLPLGSDRQGSCSWPEGTHKFICEQRPKKVRRPKQTYPDRTVELTLESKEQLEKETNVQTLNDTSGGTIHGNLQSDKIHNISFIDSGVTVTNCLTEVNVQNTVDTPVPSKKNGRCKRIFNLAPNFHLPRQISANAKEGQKDDHLSENILKTEQERTSDKDDGKNSEQNCEFQEHVASSNNDVTDSSRNCDVGSLLHNASCSQLGQSPCLSKNAVSSSAQKFPSSFYIVSSRSEEQIITFKQQNIFDKKQGEKEQLSSEIINSQPDILCSVKVISECPTNSNKFESSAESMHKANETEPSQSSQTEDNQDLLNPNSNLLGLPLSLGFAFQLVELFGSPGFPLESLLPDDYIVPLDWKTSKKIHLLWRTSLERKQKTNGLQNQNSLTVGANTVEDTNKDCQESQESYETLLKTNLLPDVGEENSGTYPDNNHLYNVTTNLECHLKQKNST